MLISSYLTERISSIGHLDLLFVLELNCSSSINATFSVSLEKRRLRAERLELMKNEPVVSADELKGIKSKTLVIAGTFDLMYGSHTKLLLSTYPMHSLNLFLENILLRVGTIRNLIAL